MMLCATVPHAAPGPRTTLRVSGVTQGEGARSVNIRHPGQGHSCPRAGIQGAGAMMPCATIPHAAPGPRITLRVSGVTQGERPRPFSIRHPGQGHSCPRAGIQRARAMMLCATVPHAAPGPRTTLRVSGVTRGDGACSFGIRHPGQGHSCPRAGIQRARAMMLCATVPHAAPGPRTTLRVSGVTRGDGACSFGIRHPGQGHSCPRAGIQGAGAMRPCATAPHAAPGPRTTLRVSGVTRREGTGSFSIRHPGQGRLCPRAGIQRARTMRPCATVPHAAPGPRTTLRVSGVTQGERSRSSSIRHPGQGHSCPRAGIQGVSAGSPAGDTDHE